MLLWAREIVILNLELGGLNNNDKMNILVYDFNSPEDLKNGDYI